MELRIKKNKLLVGKTKKMEVATREELKDIIKVAVEQLQSMNNQNYPCISIVVSTFPCDGKDTSSILVYWILKKIYITKGEIKYDTRNYEYSTSTK